MAYSSSRIKLRRKRLARHRLALRIVAGLFLFLAAVAAVGGISHWAWTKLARARVKVEMARLGVLEETTALEAVVLCSENIITAPAEGRFYPLVAEGEKVRKGQRIGSMLGHVGNGSAGGVVPVFSPANGVFCMHLDGLEGMLDRSGWERWDLFELVAANEKEGKHEASGWVPQGAPIARVVDNLENTLLAIEVPIATEESWQGSQFELWVKVRGDGSYERAVQVDQIKTGEKVRVLLTLGSFCEELLHERRVKLPAAAKRWKGIVMPEECLIKRGEEDGVYVIRKGKAVWKPVEVKTCFQGQVVLGGLEEGELVVQNPRWVQEGMLVLTDGS